MKRCKCEHWQTCPTCYPQGFDEHGARNPVEIPQSREELQREITTLREQVEKLTKERDTEIARNRPLQSLIKSQEEIKSFLLKKSEENKEAVKQLDSERQANAVLTEELAALAEQNEKLRKAIVLACAAIDEGVIDHEWNFGIIREAKYLPDLASPVLNRIKAEAYREAAEICETTFAHGILRLGHRAAIAKAIRAKADELEHSNG